MPLSASSRSCVVLEGSELEPPPVVVVAGGAPLVEALTFSSRRLTLSAFTSTSPPALRLRSTSAVALSLKTLTASAAPAPTRAPAASASAVSVRSMLPCAVTETSPRIFAASSLLPRQASTMMPEMSVAATGVAEIPPDAPAAARSSSVPAKEAATRRLSSSSLLLNFTPSSMTAETSTPMTPTAMPAPTPTLSAR